jgi:hypothetical protein
LGISVPIVIRMEGTNVAEGKKILAESGFNFGVADGMKGGAERGGEGGTMGAARQSGILACWCRAIQVRRAALHATQSIRLPGRP